MALAIVLGILSSGPPEPVSARETAFLHDAPLTPRKTAADYARSVSPIHPLPQNLPDCGVVFDALHKRDKFVPHPSGIS